jgi:3-phosphoglycerate kinase
VKGKVEGDTFSYLDIGEGAVAEFKEYLKDAKTIFWNGSLGYTEEDEFAKASTAIAEYIAELTSKGVTSIIAGGDTVEMITRLKLHEKFTFVSTGGGAALELLAGAELPGVVALEGGKKEEKKEEVVEQKEEEAKEVEPTATDTESQPSAEEVKEEESAEAVPEEKKEV